MTPGRRRVAPLLGLLGVSVALLLWANWFARTASIVAVHAVQVPRRNTWLFDWNVYHAAAQDLVDGTLYRVPLREPGHELPIEIFNYPPLAAAWPVPLLPFGVEPGGVMWLVIGVLATSAGALLGARALGLPWTWAAVVAGAGLTLYTAWPHIDSDVLLGNNNHLMFGLVGAFALAHVRGSQRLAGVLLGLAIATKLWPVALGVLLVRERRWQEMRWTAAAAATPTLAALVWLGPSAIVPLALAVVGPNVDRGIPSVQLVIWTGWARAALDWWPVWGGYAVAVALLLLPATRLLGLGLGIVAGLSLNNYLWHHYAPTLLFGLMLVLVGATVHAIAARRSGRAAAPSVTDT